MGRYRSSPTCSQCWERGHTKRSCPQYRERAENWLKENAHLKGTEGYCKPYYVQEVEEYANSAKNRVCSWCKEKGHNKRGCSIRKGASAKNIEKNKEWRAEVLERLQEVGLGVGALLESKRDSQRLYMITDMRWESINLSTSSENAAPSLEYSKSEYKTGMNYPNMVISRVKNASPVTAYYPQLFNEKGEDLFYYGVDKYEVVSPVEPCPPNDWVNDEGWAKGLF